MIASFLDLRKRTSDILHALDRNESITLLYRGKPKAVMSPVANDTPLPSACELAGFGMWADRKDMDDVAGYVRNLRKGRHHAL